MLTPLAVRLDRQRLGIGVRLMEYALRLLESQGETLFFVLGHPNYYPRAGFRSGSAAGIESPWPGNPAFMVRGTTVSEGRLVMPPVSPTPIDLTGRTFVCIWHEADPITSQADFHSTG